MLRLGGIEFVEDDGRAMFTVAKYSRQTGMRREKVPRPFAPGTFMSPGFLDEQEFAWSGLILTSSEAEQEHAFLRLSGLLADGGQSRLVVDRSELRWVDVQRVDIPEPQILTPGLVASYQVTVSAPSPYLYGEVREFPAGAAAIHYGNASATPRLLIGAGSGGYTVTGPNGRQVVVGTAPSAAHEINFANGGLYLGGVRQTGAITTYQPWKVGPGLPGTVATITGSRSLAQLVTDTDA